MAAFAACLQTHLASRQEKRVEIHTHAAATGLLHGHPSVAVASLLSRASSGPMADERTPGRGLEAPGVPTPLLNSCVGV